MSEEEPGSDNLRQRAEQFLNGQINDLDGLNGRDLQSIYHELQVHQVELKMQNEELRRTQLELQAARDQYIDLYDFAPTGYVTTNEKGGILEANRTAAQMFGCERDALIGESLHRFISPTDRDSYYLHLRKAKGGNLLHECEIQIQPEQGRPSFAARFVSACRCLTGRPCSTWHTAIIDLTEQRAAERAQREIETMYRAMFTENRTVGLLVDLFHKAIVDANPAACSFYGYPVEKMQTLFLQQIEIALDETPGVDEQEFYPQGRDVQIRQHRLASGEVRLVEIYASPLRLHDLPLSFLLIHDITERMQTQIVLKRSVHEKEVLLKEINHRVKNNMLVITTLLTLQMDMIDDEKQQEIYNLLRNRILSMSAVHEQLYLAPDVAHIDILRYISQLANQLFHAYAIHPEQITLDMEGQSVFLDMNAAIPCGLILNELISNSLKHAFPKGRTGKITVSLEKQARQIALTVRDDGVGYPSEPTASSKSSLGIQLIHLLAQQLGGKLIIEKPSLGSTTKLIFPAEE